MNAIINVFISSPLWLRLVIASIPIALSIIMYTDGSASSLVFTFAYGGLICAYIIPSDIIPDLELDTKLERDAFIALEDNKTHASALSYLVDSLQYNEKEAGEAIDSLIMKMFIPKRQRVLWNCISSVFYVCLLQSVSMVYEFPFIQHFLYIAAGFTLIIIFRYILLVGRVDS